MNKKRTALGSFFVIDQQIYKLNGMMVLSLYTQGVLYALGAFFLWGLLPIYWKWLVDVPAFEILAHRMVWSMLFVSLLLLLQNKWAWLLTLRNDRKSCLILFLATIIVSANWGIYIWAVNAGYIIETSLGYFINPLMNIAIGVFFFGERLRKVQWLAIAVAAMGVVYLTVNYGSPPWIALALASTFALYGLLKKILTLGALEGLAGETILMTIPASVYLLYLHSEGIGAFTQIGFTEKSLLLLSGVATALPLIFFVNATKRIPMSTIGIMQYLAPTIQFCIGLFLYKEKLEISQLIGFVFIWSALIIYTFDVLKTRQISKIKPSVRHSEMMND